MVTIWFTKKNNFYAKICQKLNSRHLEILMMNTHTWHDEDAQIVHVYGVENVNIERFRRWMCMLFCALDDVSEGERACLAL